MRAKCGVALVVLLTFVSSQGLPLLGDRHQFNDDPHWTVPLGAETGDRARIGGGGEADDEHCLVCHLQRTLRTASKPAADVHHRASHVVSHPPAAEAGTRAAASDQPDVRGPPLLAH